MLWRWTAFNYTSVAITQSWHSFILTRRGIQLMWPGSPPSSEPYCDARPDTATVNWDTLFRNHQGTLKSRSVLLAAGSAKSPLDKHSTQHYCLSQSHSDLLWRWIRYWICRECLNMPWTYALCHVNLFIFLYFPVEEMKAKWRWPSSRHPVEIVECMAAQSRTNLGQIPLTSFSA